MKSTRIPTPTSRMRAGLGTADITPPVGIYHRFWGAASHDQSIGVHRPLRASVLVLEPEEETDSAAGDRQILIALDHCLFRPPEMTEFREKTCARLQMASEHVTVVFSHTHSAAYVARNRAHLPGGDMIGPYLDNLPDRIAQAVDQAVANLASVTLTYGTASCRMGHHRDAWDENADRYVCGFNPDVDLDLPVNAVRMTDDAGAVRGTIVSYPCHPTTLAWDNSLISPDYVGALRETVEAATDATCLFLQAPCGDIGPRFGFVGDTEVADRNGRQVAYAALQAIESMPPAGHDYYYVGPVISGATLGEWEYRSHPDERVSSARLFETTDWTIPLQYRPELPTVAQAEERMALLGTQESEARDRGDDTEASRVRALVERQRRQLEVLNSVPAGVLPYPIRLWRLGDAIWVAVDGEPYSALQSELNRRFPEIPLIIMPLSDGAMAGYLPTADACDKPIYQAEIAILAAGCLETVIDAIAERIESLSQVP